MTWTYTPEQLATSTMMQVRLLIGDTYTLDQQMQDEEINYFISTRSTLYGAAAECCQALAAKFSRSFDFGVGTTRTSLSQMQKQYTQKAIQFNDKASLAGAGMPYAGGISYKDMLISQLNLDRVQPVFNIGMHDDEFPLAEQGPEPESGGGTGSGQNDGNF
jgi:hypothetical protein